jgi:hypothetical protein
MSKMIPLQRTRITKPLVCLECPMQPVHSNLCSPILKRTESYTIIKQPRFHSSTLHECHELDEDLEVAGEVVIHKNMPGQDSSTTEHLDHNIIEHLDEIGSAVKPGPTHSNNTTIDLYESNSPKDKYFFIYIY